MTVVIDYRVDKRLSFVALIHTGGRRLVRAVGVEAVGTLFDVPSVVAAFGYYVNLLPEVLAGIGKVEAVVAAFIKGHPIRVP
ncbi:Uncharacterised protein [uncultured archaeon]|nr:Uncharacterised protein [uncultured archaeon]